MQKLRPIRLTKKRKVLTKDGEAYCDRHEISKQPNVYVSNEKKVLWKIDPAFTEYKETVINGFFHAFLTEGDIDGMYPIVIIELADGAVHNHCVNDFEAQFMDGSKGMEEK